MNFRSWLKRLAIAGIVLGLVGGVIAAALVLPPLQLLRIALITIGLLVGAVIVPLLAYLVAPSARAIGDIVGPLLWKSAAKGQGATKLVLNGASQYELVKGHVEDGKREFWTRLARSPFAIGYERTERVFGQHATDKPPAEVGNTAGGEKIPTDSVRGGHEQFVDTGVKNPEEKIWLELPEFLSEFEDSATGSAALDADRSATVDFGGDTSDYSPLTMLFGMFLFLVSGAVLGVIII